MLQAAVDRGFGQTTEQIPAIGQMPASRVARARKPREQSAARAQRRRARAAPRAVERESGQQPPRAAELVERLSKIEVGSGGDIALRRRRAIVEQHTEQPRRGRAPAPKPARPSADT